MNFPRLTRRAFAALLLASTAFAAALPVSAQTRPNILFVLSDDQRWDALGVAQRERGARGRFPWLASATPNMDRLAREGFRFRDAFVTLSTCSPSRAAYLTGRYPHTTGNINNGRPLAAAVPTYASVLRARGWRTAYFGKWHMGSQATRPGFSEFASYVAQGEPNDSRFLFHNGPARVARGWTDDRTTDFAAAFITRNRASGPWVAVVGMKSPHGPHVPPPRLADRFAGQVSRPVANFNAFAPYDPVRAARAPGPEQVRDYTRQIVGVDQNLGRLLQALDDTGQAARTIVVYASDNGYMWGEHGVFIPGVQHGNKRDAWEESMRVPLLIRYPALGRRGVTPGGMALNIDLAPTLLDLAGVAVPAGVQGRSLAPVLRGTAASARTQPWLYEYFREAPFIVPTHTALRSSTHKLVEYQGQPSWRLLFDLRTDPLERFNLARRPDQQARVAAMRAQLAAEQRRTGYRPAP